jgi:hypothetical protein
MQRQMVRRIERLKQLAEQRRGAAAAAGTDATTSSAYANSEPQPQAQNPAAFAGAGGQAWPDDDRGMTRLEQAVREAAQPEQPIRYGPESMRGVAQQERVAAQGDEAERTARSVPHASRREMAHAGEYEQQKADFRHQGQQVRDELMTFALVGCACARGCPVRRRALDGGVGLPFTCVCPDQR